MLKRTLGFVAAGAALLLCLRAFGGPEGATSADPTEGATYLGVKRCRKCHSKQYKTWKETRHAEAWGTLPDKYHDPETSKDENGRPCVSCHVTGFGLAESNGFVDADTSKHLLGVQCEACHGPGSRHKEAADKVMKDKSRDKKTFKPDEPRFIVAKPAGCTGCHNPHVSHKKYREEDD